MLTCISNGFHFVDIKLIKNVIKGGVQFIKQFYNLEWSTSAGQTCESYNVAVCERSITYSEVHT